MRTGMAAVAALAALCILALINWQMAKAPVNTFPISAHARSQELANNETPGDALKLTAINLLQASQRPLFITDRRPWTPPHQPTVAPVAELPPDAPVTPTAPPPTVLLLGIQKTPDGSTALLSAQTGDAPLWLKEGETYQNWHVRNINGASVDLGNGDSKITLELYPAAHNGVSLP